MPTGPFHIRVQQDLWAAIVGYAPVWVVRPLGAGVRDKLSAAPRIVGTSERAFTLTNGELDELIIWMNTVRFLAGAPADACRRMLIVLYEGKQGL